MASVATWIFLWMIYFVMISVLVFSLGYGGMLDPDDVDITLSDTLNISQDFNMTSDVNSAAWDAGKGFGTLASFMTIGVNLGLGGFGNFLVTFMFVWLPTMICGILIYFAVRSGSS